MVRTVLFKMILLTKYVVWSKYRDFFLNYDTPARLKANCESIFKSIQGTLNSWKGRGLTLIGKIQIVKCFLCFIVPKFLSKATLISVPDRNVKEINKLIYHFIWKGNDIKSNDLR